MPNWEEIRKEWEATKITLTVFHDSVVTDRGF